MAIHLDIVDVAIDETTIILVIDTHNDAYPAQKTRRFTLNMAATSTKQQIKTAIEQTATRLWQSLESPRWSI